MIVYTIDKEEFEKYSIMCYGDSNYFSFDEFNFIFIVDSDKKRQMHHHCCRNKEHKCVSTYSSCSIKEKCDNVVKNKVREKKLRRIDGLDI